MMLFGYCIAYSRKFVAAKPAGARRVSPASKANRFRVPIRCAHRPNHGPHSKTNCRETFFLNSLPSKDSPKRQMTGIVKSLQFRLFRLLKRLSRGQSLSAQHQLIQKTNVGAAPC